jgi:hypothetical protein
MIIREAEAQSFWALANSVRLVMSLHAPLETARLDLEELEALGMYAEDQGIRRSCWELIGEVHRQYTRELIASCGSSV